MTQNKGKFFFGNVKDNIKKDGWFFGHFMDNPLLKSSDVEVAWQDVSNKPKEIKDKHTHNIAVEINILIKGSVSLTINGEKIEATKPGDCWIVYPETIVDEVEAGPQTELICIKAPSIPGDKYYL